jgi:DNA-binding transcriptional ArsR family regulator
MPPVTEAISRFSPSRMSPETLRAIFVQRHDLLARILEGIRDSAGSQARHHVLLVGPRGVGKTHLISLVNHETRALEDPRIRVAWLMEDETSETFVDLLARIWTALAQEYPDEFPQAVLDAARTHRGQARTILQDALIEHLEGRTLVVLVENLDEHLKNIGTDGQHELRGFLQESGVMCLIASAQQLSDDIGLRKSPLFGTFAIEPLEPLDASLAAELLGRIAAYNGDEALRAYLGTEEARRRIQVILHLAGGNHRVFVILAEFLTRASLEELVSPFEKLLDEMTPYYQSRIAWVSPQQRKIVELLCRSRQPVPVKQIAHTLFMSEQTASSQLKKLTELRYVNAAKRGRESLYELAEPLMRLCWEVKESRGEPIRLLVDFLRAWFDQPALEELQAAPDEIKDNTDDPAFLFHIVLQAGGLAGAWKSRLDDLVGLYGGIGRMGTLGTGLVRSLVHFRPERVTKAVLDDWLDALDRLAREHEGLVVPVRLYRVGLRSIDRNDPSVLLDLPVEERQIVAEVLDRRRMLLGAS